MEAVHTEDTLQVLQGVLVLRVEVLAVTMITQEHFTAAPVQWGKGLEAVIALKHITQVGVAALAGLAQIVQINQTVDLAPITTLQEQATTGVAVEADQLIH